MEDKKANWMGFRYCQRHDLGYCRKHEIECFGQKSCEENFIAHPKVDFCCICSGLVKSKVALELDSEGDGTVYDTMIRWDDKGNIDYEA